MKQIDYLLDRITMYRLVLYSLIGLLILAFGLSFFHVFTFSAETLLFSTLFLVAVCWITNTALSFAFDAPTNVESVYITALILALIITPSTNITGVMLLFWAGVLAMASKYILAIRKKHLFNPAAIAVVLTAYVLHQSASWWVGTTVMMPFVAFSGLLIIRKLHYEDMVWSFAATASITSLVITVMKDGNILNTLNQVLFHSSFIFLGAIMLTEPLTLPPTKKLQMLYGALVGFLAVPQVNLAGIFFSPEVALSIGNLLAYVVSPKEKLILTLSEKIQMSSNIIDFLFTPQKQFAYLPGQYMEWTLPHANADSRGNRRYFTLASSPTEKTIRLGVKFYHQGSSYKRAMQKLDDKTPIVGAQLAGNFTLPTNKKTKLVFISGGIGVTPFRSMLKYLVDKREVRNITHFYTNKTIDEIAYQDVFSEAEKILGIRTIYTLTHKEHVPAHWSGKIGRIDRHLLTTEVPDYMDRVFYLSGPFAMIAAIETLLKEMGVKNDHIKKDFFPGLV